MLPPSATASPEYSHYVLGSQYAHMSIMRPLEPERHGTIHVRHLARLRAGERREGRWGRAGINGQNR